MKILCLRSHTGTGLPIEAVTRSSRIKCCLVLQDNVPAFDSRQAIEIVERNLGGTIAENFESFDPQPIAAASLGQVREFIAVH